MDKYGDEILKGFQDGMRGLNNPIATYGSELDEEFNIDVEDDDDDKYMTYTKYKFNNIAVLEKNVEEKTPFLDKGGNSVITHDLNKSIAFSIGSDRIDVDSEPKWEKVSYNKKKTTKTPSILKRGGRTVMTASTQASHISSLTDSTKMIIEQRMDSDMIQQFLKSGKLAEEELRQLIREI